MDKKYTIEVHQGEDYVSFTINGKTSEWQYSAGVEMLSLFKKFIKALKK